MIQGDCRNKYASQRGRTGKEGIYSIYSSECREYHNLKVYHRSRRSSDKTMAASFNNYLKILSLLTPPCMWRLSGMLHCIITIIRRNIFLMSTKKFMYDIKRTVQAIDSLTDG